MDEAAKAAIESQLTALTGGEFRYASLDLRVLPRPTAEARQVTFRSAPVVEGTAERAMLRIAFLPLLKGEVRLSTLKLDRLAAIVRIPAMDRAPIPGDPLAAYHSAIDPVLRWLTLHAEGLELSVRDGTIEVHVDGAAPFKLDSLTLDGEVSRDQVVAKIAGRGNSWKQARVSAKIATGSHAASLELKIDDFEAAPALERLLGASAVRVLPAVMDATLVVQTDGQGSATAALSVSMPAFALARGGARVELGAARARLKATYAPGDASLVVEELALGEWLAEARGTLNARDGAGGTVLDAKAGRVDAGRVRAAAMAIAPDLSPVSAIAAIVKAGNALDVRVGATGDNMKALADLAAYDVSMGVELASLEVPVPPMELTGASGKLRIAKSVLTTRDVAATFGGSKLRNGEMTLALEPAVALRSLSTGIDLDLAENRARAQYLLRDTPLGAELDRLQSIAGRAAGTLALREEGGQLRGIYDMTSVHGTLRHPGMPLTVAVDRGGMRFETGGTLTLRGVVGSIGASRVQGLDAELAFAPGPVARSATGTGTLSLDELGSSILALPLARTLRGEVSAMQGIVDVKLARVVGALDVVERLEISAALTPRKVRIATPHLPDRLGLDGGTLRVENVDLLCDGVDVEMQDARGIVSGSIRAFASPARVLDLSIARATIGARGLEWLEDEAGIGPDARLQAPLTLERARIRWPLPAPWALDATAAVGFKNGARVEVDLRSQPGRVLVRRLTLKDQDSDVRVVFDWQPERAIVGFHGYASARSVNRLLATPIAASGTLRGDFDATVDFKTPALSRASGKLEGADVAFPAAFDVPVVVDRVSLDADGERVRVRDASLRFGDESLHIAGSLARAANGFDVDASLDVEGIDAARWLARLRSEDKSPDRASPWLRSLTGKIAVRARHLDLLGYRIEPFAASVVLRDDKLMAEVTEASLCGLAVPMTVTMAGDALDLKGSVTAKDLPVTAAAACLSKGALHASGTMDVRAEFSASGAPSSLLASSQGSAHLRARDGRLGGVRALTEVLEIDEVSQRLPKAESDSQREGFAYSALEVDAKLAGERVVIDRILLESVVLNVALQGEVRLDNRQLALTGIALPIVNTILRNVPVIGRVVRDPIIGIPISVSGDVADPQVNRVAAGAIAGTLVGALQAVVSLPVQLLGGGAAPAADPR